MLITAGTGQYGALSRIPHRGVLQTAGGVQPPGPKPGPLPSFPDVTHATERPAAWVPAKLASYWGVGDLEISQMRGIVQGGFTSLVGLLFISRLDHSLADSSDLH